MPLHMVETDLADGSLVVIDVDEMPRTGAVLTISAVRRASVPAGPAAQWFAARMAAGANRPPRHADSAG